MYYKLWSIPTVCEFSRAHIDKTIDISLFLLRCDQLQGRLPDQRGRESTGHQTQYRNVNIWIGL